MRSCGKPLGRLKAAVFALRPWNWDAGPGWVSSACAGIALPARVCSVALGADVNMHIILQKAALYTQNPQVMWGSTSPPSLQGGSPKCYMLDEGEKILCDM